MSAYQILLVIIIVLLVLLITRGNIMGKETKNNVVDTEDMVQPSKMNLTERQKAKFEVFSDIMADLGFIRTQDYEDRCVFGNESNAAVLFLAYAGSDLFGTQVISANPTVNVTYTLVETDITKSVLELHIAKVNELCELSNG